MWLLPFMRISTTDSFILRQECNKFILHTFNKEIVNTLRIFILDKLFFDLIDGLVRFFTTTSQLNCILYTCI